MPISDQFSGFQLSKTCACYCPLVVVTLEAKYSCCLGCKGEREGGCLSMVHKCVVLIATSKNRDSPIERRSKRILSI